ncbi:hypothetical protein [Sporosarcina limicola]|uniref:Copper amine oxidase-like N-terminal domain-containing protein n=1 Tax=Sporosarcina limicola TaxID=34101 RepID=A0A927R602_9BACL|nr:hypothetical protein [Sporosarcina limicola]MBE1556638.1 hypothetical protein [Sporosarcina limicola]
MSKLLKLVLSLLLIFAVGYSFSESANAESRTYHLFINSKMKQWESTNEYEPIIKNGILFVPLEAFANTVHSDLETGYFDIPDNTLLFKTANSGHILIPNHTEKVVFIDKNREFELEAKSFIVKKKATWKTLVYVPLSFITAKDGLNLNVEKKDYLDRSTLIYNDKERTMPIPPVSTEVGKSYPDGWTAPKLTSSLDMDPAKMQNVFTAELGFTDGRFYDLPSRASVIRVESFRGGGAVITHSMWEQKSVKESYRIPIVTLELLKLYFGNDAVKVVDYYEKGNLSAKPLFFEAGGMYGYIVRENGKTILRVGREPLEQQYYMDYENHCKIIDTNKKPVWNGQAFHKNQIGSVKVLETTNVVNRINKIVKTVKKGTILRVLYVENGKLTISSDEFITLDKKVAYTEIPAAEQFAMSCALGSNIEMPKMSAFNGSDYVFTIAESFTGVKKMVGVNKKTGSVVEFPLTGPAKNNALSLVELRETKNAIYTRDANYLDVIQTSLKKPFGSKVILKDVSHYEVLSNGIVYVKVERKSGKIVQSAVYTSDLDGKNNKLVKKLDATYTFSPIFGYDDNAIAVIQYDSKTGKNELQSVNLKNGKITVLNKFPKGTRYSEALVKMNGKGSFVIGIQKTAAATADFSTDWFVTNMKGAILGKFKVEGQQLLSVHLDKGKFSTNMTDFMHGAYYNVPIQSKTGKRDSLTTKDVAGKTFYKRGEGWYLVR